MAASTAPANQPPTRFPSGVTSDPPYGPLANSGGGNPFFYQQFEDDFTSITAGKFATDPTSVAGDGGLVTLAAGTPLQAAVASFVLPNTGNNPPKTSTSSKKMFFLARLQLTTVAGSGFLAGFGVAGTTFTGVATGLSGMFIFKPAASNVVSLVNAATAANSPSGVAYSVSIPLDPQLVSESLVNATSFDVAFEIDRNQNVFAYIGPQLVGWWPQSGRATQIGGVGTFVAGTPDLPVRGHAASNYNWLAQATGMAGNVATPMMFTQTPLAPLIAVSGSAGQADFILGQKER